MTYRKGVPSWYSGSKDNLYYQDNFEDDRKYDNPVQEFMLKNKGEFFKIEERETPKYLELPTSLPPKNREQFEPTQKEEPTSIPFEYQGKYKNAGDLAESLKKEASPYENTFFKLFGAPQKLKDEYADKLYGGEFDKRAKEIWDNELKKDSEALKGFQDKNGFSKFLDVTAEKARREFTGGTHKNIIQNQDLGTVGNVASDIIGGVAGFLNPEMGVAKTSQFAEGLSNKFIKGSGKAAEWGKTALKGGLETLPQDFIRSNSEGEDLQGAAESAIKQGLLGAGFEVGLKGVGKAINNFSKPKGMPDLQLPSNEKTISDIPDITKPIDMPKSDALDNNPFSPFKPASQTLPIEQRDFNNVGNKKINAIAYENEDLKPFIQSEANILAGELDRTMPGSRGATQVRNGNTVESIPYSQSKVSSEGIEAIQSATGASYEKIKKALNAIQEDHGKENNALSKKIELIIDNRLTNGYADDVMGMDIPPHPDYILAKENIKEGLPNTHLNTPQKDKFKVMPSNIEKEMPQIDIDIPKSEIALSNDLLGESKFKTNTWRNAEFMQDPATQKVINDINAVYEVKPNQQSFEIANAELNKDFDGFVNRIKTNGIKNAEDSVGAGIVTNKLLSQAKENGDYSQVKDWLQTVRPQVTDIAQSLQALSTWKQLTPEGTLLKAQRVVDSATEEIKKSNPRMFNDVMEKVNANPDMANDILKKAGIPQLTNDDVAFITNQMDKIEGMENGRAKDIEFAKVKQLIADKVPSTFKDKALAYQRISLLLNPKTMTRNVLGNVVMGGLENIKDIPATLIDKAIGSRTGSRTTTLPSLPTQLKGLGKGFKEAVEDFKLGVDTSPSSGQFDLPQSQAFRKGVMGKLEKATSFGLTLGDRPFWQGAYDESLRQQMKLNKVSVASEEMKQKAKEFAEDRTFQNVSGLVDGFKSLQKGLNFGKNVGLGNIVLPFTKTPANILDKAIDYSPIGGIKGATNLVMGLKNGTLDQKKVVDQLSRGLTGSTLIAMGYQMAKSGLLTGKSDKDKDVAALEKQAGKSEYAWKLGDTYRTVDWMQPAAIPLMIGADIFHQGKDSKHLNNTIVEAVMSGGDTLFKQSLLQGVQKFFGGSGNSAGFMDNLADAGLNAATQMVPSGLKQVNQLMDKKARDTSGDGKVESTINQMKSRIPGLAQTLPGKVDTMGRDINQFQGKNNPFNVLFNPGYTTKFDPSPGEKLALNIYENGGGKEFFPRVVDKKIEVSNKGKKETFNLTPAQKQEYQKLLGENTAMEFDKLGRDSNFSKMSTESQSEKLEKILSKVSKSSKEEMIRRLKNNR